MNNIQIWGGLECTLNRVGDTYIDQCEKNGHYNRLSDLKLFHDLGIKKLRYPCLWEKVAPKDLDHCDWSFLDERLNEMKNLGQDFIAGFLHHGSGPLYTSLVDPDFPEKFATYARLFIQRYPWVNDFTPINEINTTARFSVLYGHWYPHLQDETMFIKSLLLQCKATVLAMKEIRAVNPKARLIQTDDLGKCQSTELLSYQRDFENERRWLSWDVLCGKLTKDHPLYQRIIKLGISADELNWFEENPFPPSVIGINHYLLSNRYLDHRLEMFPEWSHGGNGKHSYADVGAVDTGLVNNPEPLDIMQDAWDRYGIPLAITECHIRGRRESQLRWLAQVWNDCRILSAKGVQIEAVTAWSLLGTFDWNKLCTTNDMFYESGVFDLANSERTPEPTALAKMIRSLADNGDFNSPLLKSQGIWQTPRRILFNAQTGQYSSLEHHNEAHPVLVIGATAELGRAFAKVCGFRNIHYKVVDKHEPQLENFEALERLVNDIKPWAIIEGDKMDFNHLPDFCRRQNIHFVHLTSEMDSSLPTLSAPNDIIDSSTFAEKVADDCLDLLIDGVNGIIPLAKVGEMSWDDNKDIFLELHIPREQEITL